MKEEGMINEMYDQIKGWQREIDHLEDMKEAAYKRIDELQESVVNRKDIAV